MKLKIHQKAPVFTKNDIWGQPVNLLQPGHSATLISFFRYAECALCNLRIAEILRHKTQLDREGIRFIAVFESPAESLRAHVADRHQLPFSIIADPERELYDLYQVKPSWWKLWRSLRWKSIIKVMAAWRLGFQPGGKVEGAFHQIPADFLIDPAGNIRMTHYGSHVVDHLPLTALWGLARPVLVG